LPPDTVSPKHLSGDMSYKLRINYCLGEGGISKLYHPPCRTWTTRAGSLRSLAGSVLSCTLLLVAPAHARPAVSEADGATQAQQASQTAGASVGQTSSQLMGSIVGTVVDQGGAVAVGAQVRLTRPDQPRAQQVSSGDNGQFSFSNLPPGPFDLTITAPGFETTIFTGLLTPGASFIVPEMVLNVAPATTTVEVGLTTEQVAQIQIRQEEKQRVLGIAPNFYVTYIPDAAPLTAKQKFQLAWRSVADPVTLLGVGTLAGIHQAANDYVGLGQEAGGYGKRFSAAYASLVTGAFIDDAVLASLLKQDPRYFYQGIGTTRSRLLHALNHAVVRKGDDGHWQPNYSGIIGSFASSGLSSLYYPERDRTAGLVVQNALVGIAGRAVGGIFQEFVLRKFTSHANP
jgi:Carboxypeptidase regulatory-like domain